MAVLAFCEWSQALSLREPEALYLEDIDYPEKVILEIDRTVPVYASRTFNAFMRNFIAGERVELIAYSPLSYLVRNVKDGFEGWTPAKDMKPIPEETLKEIHYLEKEAARFVEALKNKEIVSGMSFELVRKILGKPDNKSFRQDQHGRKDIWEYVEYKTTYIHQSARDVYGRLYYRSIPIREPVGRMIVEFQEGRVTAVEHSSNAP
jgi:hypothetical protein